MEKNSGTFADMEKNGGATDNLPAKHFFKDSKSNCTVKILNV
jgi:hypothetical protein